MDHNRFDPETVDTQEVNEAGQVYVGRDLEGQTVQVGVEPVQQKTSGSHVDGTHSQPIDIDLHDQLRDTNPSDVVEAIRQECSMDSCYWGPQMDRISKHLIKRMVEYNEESDTNAEKMTLQDFFYFFWDADTRERFVELCENVGVDNTQWIVDKIEDYDETDLQPIQARL